MPETYGGHGDTMVQAFQPRRAQYEATGRAVSRGAMLFTHCLLPLFHEQAHWNIYMM